MASARRASAQDSTAGTAANVRLVTAEQEETEEGVQYEFAQVTQRRENRHEITYELLLRQQPKHSRMCGVGEKGNVQRADRRPVDPPPIIQLKVSDPALPETEANAFLQNPYYFTYASLVMPDSPEELHLLRDGRTRATAGSVVSSLHHLKDIDNADAGFFVFPDLSVRVEGTYRLKFSLFEIVAMDVFHCTYIYSEPFTVYSAKRFPGMEGSTVLSRSFADQGMKVRIRKEIRIRRRFGKRKESGQQEGETSPKRARQRLRNEGSGEEVEEGNGSEGGESKRASPAVDPLTTSEAGNRPAYYVPYSYEDPYYTGGPWGGRPPPPREAGLYPPPSYYYPPPIGQYQGMYPHQGPLYPPRRLSYPYGMPSHPYSRYPDPTVESAYAYGQPQRPLIPGGHSNPPEGVQTSARPSNLQMIPPPGAAMLPPPGAAMIPPPGAANPSPPQLRPIETFYHDEHRGPMNPPNESSSSTPAIRAGEPAPYTPYRGYYPYHAPPWYDPYAPYFPPRER